MLLNEKVSNQVTKHPDACERVRKVLLWLKQNHHLYKTFLSRYETIYNIIYFSLQTTSVYQPSTGKEKDEVLV